MTQQDATSNRVRAVWEKAFLKSLSTTGNVSEACRLAKIERSTAYRQRESTPEFAAEWNDAIEAAADLLEQEARRRAEKGVLKPVYQQGKMVGKVREYSDSLMAMLLKAAKPEKYRDRTDVTSGGQPIKTYIGVSPDDWPGES